MKSKAVQYGAPFGSKVLPDGRKLFSRFTGISQTLTNGENIFTWTQANYALAKLIGMEIINASLGDTCGLFVLDSTSGLITGVPNYVLNQFGFAANIKPDFYSRESKYDADIPQTLQLKFVYQSVGAKTIYINLDMNEVVAA